MTRRSRAREVVLQVLYRDDIHPGHDLAEADLFLRRRLLNNTELVEFALGLLSGTRRNRPEIDALLNEMSKHWTVARMPVTDRNVLRLGAYEILNTETPGPVVINEAVELARRYGTRQSAQFVNGLLDRLHQSRRGPQGSAS